MEGCWAGAAGHELIHWPRPKGRQEPVRACLCQWVCYVAVISVLGAIDTVGQVEVDVGAQAAQGLQQAYSARTRRLVTAQGQLAADMRGAAFMAGCLLLLL